MLLQVTRCSNISPMGGDDLKLGRTKKFIVQKVGDFEGEAGNYFVLAPERDRPAFEALKVYASLCEDTELKTDIEAWIKQIARKMGWEDDA